MDQSVDSDSERQITPQISGGEATLSNTSQPEISSHLSWEPLVLDGRDKIVRLWDKFKDFPFVFDDSTKEMPLQAFYNMLMNPTNVFYELGDEVGLAIATNVRPRVDANFHVIFFDRRVKGRDGTLLEILENLFHIAKLHRVTTIVPEDNEILQKLYTRMGFVHEGTMRQASLRRGEYCDMLIYGLLREEMQ